MYGSKRWIPESLYKLSSTNFLQKFSRRIQTLLESLDESFLRRDEKLFDQKSLGMFEKSLDRDEILGQGRPLGTFLRNESESWKWDIRFECVRTFFLTKEEVLD